MKISAVLSHVVSFTALAATALAHDPYEITTEAWLRPTALELDTTMARSTAMDVLEGKTDAIPFDPAKFEELRAKFETRGLTLFTLTANDTSLPAPTVKAELTIENDLALHIVYPRPPAGTLRFDAPHVAKLGYGYGNVLTVHGDQGALLGQKMLTANEATLDVTVGPAPAPAKAAAPTAAPKTDPTPSQTATSERKFRPGVAVAAIVCAAIVAFLLRKRVRPTPTK